MLPAPPRAKSRQLWQTPHGVGVGPSTQFSGAIAPMYALVLATGFLGVLVNIVFRFIERKTLAWHSSVRSEAL